MLNAILFIIVLLLILDMYNTKCKFKPVNIKLIPPESKKRVQFNNNVKLFKYDYNPHVPNGHFDIPINDNVNYNNIVHEDSETYEQDYVSYGISPFYNICNTFSTFDIYDNEEYLNVNLTNEIADKHNDSMAPIIKQKFREKKFTFFDNLL